MLALMHALTCLVKLRMDLSTWFCGKSCQVNWRATISSEVFFGHGWYFWWRSSTAPGHGSL